MTAAISVRAPLAATLSWKVDTAFVPASAMTRWPNGSKAIANGTVPGSAFTVGLADRRPPKPTPNTSMSLPLPLVVTTTWAPSGVNATCPGVVNCGVAFGSRPSARREPGMRARKLPWTR